MYNFKSFKLKKVILLPVYILLVKFGITQNFGLYFHISWLQDSAKVIFNIVIVMWRGGPSLFTIRRPQTRSGTLIYIIQKCRHYSVFVCHVICVVSYKITAYEINPHTLDKLNTNIQNAIEPLTVLFCIGISSMIYSST